MKNLILLFVALLSMSLISACGAVQSATGKHDLLVQYYNDAVTATSTFGACADSAVAQVNLSNNTLRVYVDTESQRVQDWRNSQQQATESYTEARERFNNEQQNGSDLNQMVENQATPADLGSAFNVALSAYAPTEAVLPTLPTDVFTQVLDIQSEAANMMFGCAVDWNEAASRYNSERAKINSFIDSGRIIGDAASALGVTDLPSRLPLYQSSTNDGTIPTFGQ